MDENRTDDFARSLSRPVANREAEGRKLSVLTGLSATGSIAWALMARNEVCHAKGRPATTAEAVA